MLLLLCLIPFVCSLVLLARLNDLLSYGLGHSLVALFTAIPLFIYSVDLSFQVV